MFFVHCVGGCIGQKKPDQGNSWWSQLIIDLPDETPTASCCPLSFHILSECFMFFFRMVHHVSPCCIISHMCSPCFHHCTTFPNVSGCFTLGNGGENIGKWLFHQCFTYVHHFSMVLQNYCWPFLKPLFTIVFFRFSHMLNRCFTICNTMIKPFCVTCSHLSWLILTLAIRMWPCFDIINSQNHVSHWLNIAPSGGPGPLPAESDSILTA